MGVAVPAVPGPVAAARQQALGDLLRRSALRYPDKLAIVGDGERLRYAELDERVNRTANGLRDRGVAQGDRIVLLSRNSLDFVVVLYALAKLGAIAVPVNFMLNGEEIAYVLDHSGAVGIVSSDELVPVAEDAGAAALRERIVLGTVRAGWTSLADVTAAGGPDEPDVEIADDDPLQLMYTSGTESRPKGVMMSSRSLVAEYVSCIVDGEMTTDDVEIHSLPLYHAAQLHCFLGPDVYVGATSIILPAPDPATVLETIEREGVTKFFAAPTVWISLLRHPDFDRRDLSTLRKGYYGAAIMPTEVLQELQRRLPNVRLFNFYGQTELGPLATVLKPEDQLRKLGSAGKPSLNCETRIADDDGVTVRRGEVGEIVHRTSHALRGYWNDPEKTAETFAGEWFHSGDLGVMDDDGYITVVDRKKDMIKTGGENVASREVEEAIYGSDAVAEVAVFGIAHPYWIEAVTAAVIPRDGATLTPEEVTAHCKRQLAGYKVPKYVVIVDELPKNPSGKILKRQLRETWASLAGD